MKKLFLLLTMGVSFGAASQNFENKCFEHYDSFASLKLNNLIKDKKQFEMSNDDRFIAQCNNNKSTVLYNDYKSDMTKFNNILEDNNKTSVIFNKFNFTNKRNKDFINQFLFLNRRTKLDDITISYKNVYKKEPTLADTMPLMTFSINAKNLTLECNNKNGNPWILNTNIRKFKLRSITFKNCNIENSEMLYKINAYSIGVIDSTLDKPIYNHRFDYGKKINLKNNN